MKIEDDLTSTGIQTYLYLIKVGKPAGPREIMRGAKLSSPSVAYRNLQKLIDMDLVIKDNLGNYLIKKKIGIQGYFWIGKRLMPRFILFGIFLLFVLIVEIMILVPHILANTTVEGSFWLLTIFTIAIAIIFLIEGLNWRNQKDPSGNSVRCLIFDKTILDILEGKK